MTIVVICSIVTALFEHVDEPLSPCELVGEGLVELSQESSSVDSRWSGVHWKIWDINSGLDSGDSGIIDCLVEFDLHSGGESISSLVFSSLDPVDLGKSHDDGVSGLSCSSLLVGKDVGEFTFSSDEGLHDLHLDPVLVGEGSSLELCQGEW